MVEENDKIRYRGRSRLGGRLEAAVAEEGCQVTLWHLYVGLVVGGRGGAEDNVKI